MVPEHLLYNMMAKSEKLHASTCWKLTLNKGV
jgi:hypothetical protein